jgi:hypothetical protein
MEKYIEELITLSNELNELNERSKVLNAKIYKIAEDNNFINKIGPNVNRYLKAAKENDYDCDALPELEKIYFEINSERVCIYFYETIENGFDLEYTHRETIVLFIPLDMIFDEEKLSLYEKSRAEEKKNKKQKELELARQKEKEALKKEEAYEKQLFLKLKRKFEP